MSTVPPELRTDLFTGRQVLIAEARSARPQQTQSTTLTIDPAQDPFLEGHESETPHERLALRQTDSDADGPGWLVRVVPNRYPAVATEDGSAVPTTARRADRQVVRGVHDVVIECPDARTSWLAFSEIEIARVLAAWQRRLQILRSDPVVQHVSVFRNEGARAGASLPHSHSQILATELVPASIAERCVREQRSHEEHGAGLFDQWLKIERNDGSRIVAEDNGLITICPPAPRVAWQTRIGPLDASHRTFEELNENRLRPIAEQIARALQALRTELGPFSTNLLLHLPPAPSTLRSCGLTATDCPWMLDIVPRTAGIAGYELMTDVDIVTVSPETAAAKIRAEINRPSGARKTDLHSSDDAGDQPAEVCPAGYRWC